MKLHNFYIDHCGRKVVGGLEEDEAFVHYQAFRSDNNANAVPMSLNRNRVPEDLLGSGHHSRDQMRYRRRDTAVDRTTPMRKMMAQVVQLDLARPNTNMR
jgi:hypothetical protein